MFSTLSERLRQAMEGPPPVTAAALARACKVKPPSVHAWLSGRTKTIEGANLLAAAKLLGVSPDWLASGVGPMRAASYATAEPPAGYLPDPQLQTAMDLLHQLRPERLQEAICFMRWQLADKAPPGDGQALSLAAKKTGASAGQ